MVKLVKPIFHGRLMVGEWLVEDVPLITGGERLVDDGIGLCDSLMVYGGEVKGWVIPKNTGRISGE